jgi:hypothetical protein
MNLVRSDCLCFEIKIVRFIFFSILGMYLNCFEIEMNLVRSDYLCKISVGL